MRSALLEVQVEQELDRRECNADPSVFVERHCTIEEPDGTVLPFTLWDCQRETLTALEEETGVIVLKARRLGLSWVVLAFALWFAIFQQGVRILLLCKNEDDASNLLDRIRRMRDRILLNPASAHILDGLEPGAGRDAVTTLDIGASTIRALVGTPAAARSETAGLVILDEFAFQRGAGEIWRAILPTIEGGGRIAVVSTGNGHALGDSVGAEFAKQWARAKQLLSGFRAIFFPWMARPGRDQAWKTATEARLGDPTRFAIEYPETEDDAFLVADADLIYPGSHLDAAELLGRELDAAPRGERPNGPLYLGIDFGVNTHMILARNLPGRGIWALREVHSRNADLEQDVRALATILDELGEDPVFVRWDPGAAGAKVIGSFLTQLATLRPNCRPKRMAIPFSKYKLVAIRYAKLLLRRTHDKQPLRVMAISPTGCPELLRQMRKAEWADEDASKTEKGDDHGHDGLLTLTAEPGLGHFQREPND